jgi:FKBP-type peptidyl-prolyl cis-trans isomerase
METTLSKHSSSSSLLFLATAGITLALTACGRSPSATEAVAASTVAATAPADATAATDAAQIEADRAAALAAKEQELAEREAVLKQQEVEAELAKRNAENAAAAAADERARAAASAAAAKKKAAATTAAVAPAVKTVAPPQPIVVPAGTPLAIELTSDVSTKTAKVGDRVQGRLQSDLMVGDRRAASAGAPVQGAVTQVVSGSSKIGGVPTLGLEIDSLVVANGTTVPVSGQLVQQGKSDTGKDTAKILGGAAAGAIIGHQINHKNGSVVGGILGGAAGTAAAQKTGGEVVLAAGTVISVTTASAFQVDRS